MEKPVKVTNLELGSEAAKTR